MASFLEAVEADLRAPLSATRRLAPARRRALLSGFHALLYTDDRSALGAQAFRFCRASHSRAIFDRRRTTRSRIGKGVFIDHGMGVVIGETGSRRRLRLSGVTLGGTSLAW
jgi:serine acetyltransferase